MTIKPTHHSVPPRTAIHGELLRGLPLPAPEPRFLHAAPFQGRLLVHLQRQGNAVRGLRGRVVLLPHAGVARGPPPVGVGVFGPRVAEGLAVGQGGRETLR